MIIQNCHDYWVRYYRIYKRVLECLHRDFHAGRCVDNAAILTVTTLLSLVPLMTLIYSTLRFMPGMTEIGVEVESWIFEQLVPSRSDEIRMALQNFSSQASHLTLIGSCVLLLTSVMMLARIEACLNAVWQVRPASAGLGSFLRYWAVLSLGPILIGVGIFITSYLASIRILGNAVEMIGAGNLLLSLFPLVLTIGTFTLIYTAVPNCHVPLKAALVGSTVAAILFELSKRVFAWFVTAFPSYELIYGAFAALPIFIIWLNLCWIVILFGGVVSRTFSVDVMRRTRVPDLAAGIEVLQVLSDAQINSWQLNERSILKSLPWLSRYQWDRVRELLETHRLIVRTHDDSYVLVRPLGQLTQYEVLRVLGWIRPTDDAEVCQGLEIGQLALKKLNIVESELKDEVFACPANQWNN